MNTKTESDQRANLKDRRVETNFRILDTEREHRDAKEWATLRVVTWHDKNRRAYVSRVSRIMLNDRGGYRASFDLMDRSEEPAPVEIEPTARYSADKLREVHDDYLSHHLGGADQFDAAIAWARKALEA